MWTLQLILDFIRIESHSIPFNTRTIKYIWRKWKHHEWNREFQPNLFWYATLNSPIDWLQSSSGGDLNHLNASQSKNIITFDSHIFSTQYLHDWKITCCFNFVAHTKGKTCFVEKFRRDRSNVMRKNFFNVNFMIVRCWMLSYKEFWMIIDLKCQTIPVHILLNSIILRSWTNVS